MSPPTSRARLPMIVRFRGLDGSTRVNREFVERFGLEARELEREPFLDWIHEQDRERLSAVIEAGEGETTARHRTGDGDWVELAWTVRSDAGQRACIGLYEEEPDPARSTPPSSEISGSASKTMLETLHAMARIVESKYPGMLCSIHLLDDDKEYVVGSAGPGLPEGYMAALEGLRIGPGVGSCGTAAFWNVPVVAEDIATDPLWADYRELAAAAGLGACWSQPIQDTEGQVIGTMALYHAEPCRPTQAQLDALEIGARMVGLAVERDRLEAQLRQAAKLEALGVLAGGIAHDFNNFLAAILGNAELAAGDLPEGSEAAEMVREIVTASLGATELCTQMLAYAGRSSPVTDTVDLGELVTELGGLLKVALSKKARLEFRLGPEPVGVRADRSQIRQVVMNLITNASEAIGNREGTITISTRVREFRAAELRRRQPDAELAPGTFAVLTVADDGRGMDAATQAKIFDPFFTTKATGRGLGLAAVRGIVRGHGGFIDMESRPGEGTTFELVLPLQPLRGGTDAEEPRTGPTRRDAHVLVVDDETQVRAIHAKILRRAGYTVTEAGDGREALEVFQQERDSIDGVLLDLSMPKLDGDEVFRALRELRADLPILLCSGYTEQQVLERFEKAEFAGVVKKPAQASVLLAKLDAALGAATG